MPIVFKSQYDESLILMCADFGEPEEYNTSDGKYLLIVRKFSKIEQYGDNIVITKGSLRILFDMDLKIEIFEFLSNHHQEISPKHVFCNELNDYGITPQFSRILIISESLTEMNASIEEFISKFEN